MYPSEDDKQREKEPPKDRKRRLLRQAWMVVQASLGMVMMGSLFTFPSVLFSDLATHNTTICGTPVTIAGLEDYVGSLVILTSLLGAWVGAALGLRLGRRLLMMAFSVIAVLGWLIMALVPASAGILTARCVSGLALGGFSVVINPYIVELSDADVRGAMAMFANLSILLGQLVTVCLGYVGRYYVVALILAAVPAVMLLCLRWLPESPAILVLKDKEPQARKVLRALRGPYADLSAEIEHYRNSNQVASAGETGGWGARTWLRLFRKVSLRKCLLIVSGLFIIVAFSGGMPVNVYAYRMFEDAGTTVDGQLAVVAVMLVQLGAGVAGFFLLDKIGRKNVLYTGFLLLASAFLVLAIFIGVKEHNSAQSAPAATSYNESSEPMTLLTTASDGLELVGLTGEEVTGGGTELVLEEEVSGGGWVPLACLMVSQTGLALGLLNIPFLLAQEYFPTTLRAQATCVCFSVWTVACYVALQTYTPMLNAFTQAGLYAFYAAVSFTGIIFTVFCVRETMGQKTG